MIVTIDGPAGAGKSTVARRTAQRLTEIASIPFEYLDTGSMYRAVALLGLRHHVDWNVPERLELLAEQAKVDLVSGKTFLDGEEVTDSVRSPEVTKYTRFAANNPRIRQHLVELQRAVAFRALEQEKGVVTEGRDQGTVVFPEAPCKIFLTATPEERARRRCEEFCRRGEKPDFEKTLQEINARDERDASRAIGPLRKPEDATEIITDNMNIEEVVERLVGIVQNKMGLGDFANRFL